MQKWNPYPQIMPPTVDDGITEESDYLLVTDKEYNVTIAYLYRTSPRPDDEDDLTWILRGAYGDRAKFVTAWMPLPAAYVSTEESSTKQANQ